jgi:DNA topoisomerase-1
MDKAAAKTTYAPPGVSIRNGPVVEEKMDVDEPVTNGNAKRKARVSTGKPVNYNDDSDESDAVPLVRGDPLRKDHIYTPIFI